MSCNEKMLDYRNKINEALKASNSETIEFHVNDSCDSVSRSNISTDNFEKLVKSPEIRSSRDFSLEKPSIETAFVTLNVFQKNISTLKRYLNNDYTFTKLDGQNGSDDSSSYSIISSDNSKTHEKSESVNNTKTFEKSVAFKGIKSREKPQSSSLCQLGNSTRDSFTQEWIKSFVSVDNSNTLDENLDTQFDEEFTSLNSETEVDEECDSEDSIPESDDFNFDHDLTEDNSNSNDELAADCESSSSGSSFIVFSESAPEESCSTVLSQSVKGSLIFFEEEEFSSNEDEFFYSSTSGICSDWEDVVKGGSELSQGFDNEGFIMDNFLKSPPLSKRLQEVNEKWRVNMADVEERPRDPVKITFAPSSTLVIVHNYEKFEEEEPSYDFYTLDRLHFQKRVNDFSVLMSPFLTIEHRANVMLRNMLL